MLIKVWTRYGDCILRFSNYIKALIVRTRHIRIVILNKKNKLE